VSVPEDGRRGIAGDLTAERHLAINSDSLVTRRHHERRTRWPHNTTSGDQDDAVSISAETSSVKVYPAHMS